MDYEKKYNEMVRRAKELHESGNALTRQQMEIVCPELTESEDERMIKAILSAIRGGLDTEKFLEKHGTNYEEVEAYLEKQKEQKSVVEVLVKVGLKPYRDGNQWCILAGDNIQDGICGFGDTIDDALYNFLMEVLNIQKEQKPAEWSEEDDALLKEIVSFFKDGTVKLQHDLDLYAGFLQNKFKSLHPSWKPSEEQLEALLNAEDLVRANNYPENAKILASLYEQLKKLM